MNLRELASELPGARILHGPDDAEITSVVYDSRQARPGALFVAVPGLHVDGHDYASLAIAAGASAVVVQEEHAARFADLEAPVVAVPDTRVALAHAAAALNGHPARKLKVVGVTGTDGKTSLCHLIAHVFNSTGHKAGLISTAECRIGDEPLPDTGRYTTPEAPEVQAMLAQMLAAGCEWAIIEATSHGLALHRVDACEYDIAVMTNVGSDHLDFHGSREAYVAAKSRLFEMLGQGAGKGLTPTAVLNADDPAFNLFRSLTSASAVTYAISSPGDITPSAIRTEGWLTHFWVQASGVGFQSESPLDDAPVILPRPGDFNVANALAATAVALAAGLPLDAIVTALESWPGAPGRMELVDAGQPFRVVVDFAHSPDSLRRVLELLRRISRGRLIAVFGCIGERDTDRRFGMGAAAAELADYTIVTDDNPYTEDRMAIIAEIARGLESAGKREGHDFAVVPDRREAIAQALGMAVDEDCILLAGKGHERDVHLPDGVYDCHDPTVAREVLAGMGYAGLL